jgi:hypothetical protein
VGYQYVSSISRFMEFRYKKNKICLIFYFLLFNSVNTKISSIYSTSWQHLRRWITEFIFSFSKAVFFDVPACFLDFQIRGFRYKENKFCLIFCFILFDSVGAKISFIYSVQWLHFWWLIAVIFASLLMCPYWSIGYASLVLKFMDFCCTVD